jgi:D-alanine-D-alanine ligase
MKIKLGVFFGGKSVEHEIAVITASQALEAINKEKYEIVPIYISKKGVLYTGDPLLDLQEYKDMDALLKKCTKVAVVNDGESVKVLKVPAPAFGKQVINTIDVAFPIVHGTNCEDGTVAGYLNLLGLPFIGPDVVSSGLGMDKIFMKKVLKESGIPVVNYYSFYSEEYVNDEEKIRREIN